MTLTYLALYMATAALFYLRLTATATTATDTTAPKSSRAPHWHRARRLTKSFLRRVRPALPKR